MDFQDAYQVGIELRKLLRRADRFGYDLQTLKEQILFMAEAKETYAEHMEMKAVVQLQSDWVETN